MLVNFCVGNFGTFVWDYYSRRCFSHSIGALVMQIGTKLSRLSVFGGSIPRYRRTRKGEKQNVYAACDKT